MDVMLITKVFLEVFQQMNRRLKDFNCFKMSYLEALVHLLEMSENKKKERKYSVPTLRYVQC